MVPFGACSPALSLRAAQDAPRTATKAGAPLSNQLIRRLRNDSHKSCPHRGRELAYHPRVLVAVADKVGSLGVDAAHDKVGIACLACRALGIGAARTVGVAAVAVGVAPARTAAQPGVCRGPFLAAPDGVGLRRIGAAAAAVGGVTAACVEGERRRLEWSAENCFATNNLYSGSSSWW